MNISQQQIFQYLKENLDLELESETTLVGGEYGHEEKNLTVKMKLKNPDTGKFEVISESTTDLYSDFTI